MNKVEAKELRTRSAARFASLAIALLSTMLLGTAPRLVAQQAAVQAPTQAAQTSTATKPAPDAVELERWRQTILHTKKPKKACYLANYPDTAWTEVTCTKPPTVPQSQGKGPRANNVGGGNPEYSAQVASGRISESEGSFDSAIRVTSEADSGANAFTLQLNTEFLPFISACAPISGGCRGWEQFVFSNSKCQASSFYPHLSSKACVYIEYWLIGYGSCPSSWHSDDNGDCWINSTNATPVPPQTVTNAELESLKLTGQIAGVSGADDSVTLSIGSAVYSAPGDDYIFDLASWWQISEFNIFGDCCGSQAAFNSGSTLVVRTVVNSGTTSAPTCSPGGYTAESNNLTLVGPCSPVGGASPAIVFTETQLGVPAGTRALLYDRTAGEADLVGFTDKGILTLDFPNFGFRKTWDRIVAGDFLGNDHQQVLAYDRNAGHADIIAFDSYGAVSLDAQNGGFRTTWDIIVVGDFFGNGQQVLLYDRAAGQADIVAFDKKGGVLLDAQNPSFGTWDKIVVGDFLGSGQQQQVLAYDRNAGQADVIAFDSKGKVSLKAVNTEWRKTWDEIVVGDFLGDGGRQQALLYDRAAGHADVVAFDKKGGVLLDAQNPGFGNSWDKIVAGDFLGNGQQVLAYDRNAGQADVIAFNSKGIVSKKIANTEWRKTWDEIRVGDFTGKGGQQVLLYDRAAGWADVVAFDDKGGVSLDAQNPSFGNLWNWIVAGDLRPK
jgi:hypothetical protein